MSNDLFKIPNTPLKRAATMPSLTNFFSQTPSKIDFQGDLDEYQKGIYIGEAQKDYLSLNGKIVELKIKNYSFKIVIGNSPFQNFPHSRWKFEAQLWINNKKVEGIFIIDTGFVNPYRTGSRKHLTINGVENLIEFVEKLANPQNQSKKRKASEAFPSLQNQW